MSERKLASLWTRVIGAAIDVCILFVITYALCYVWTSNAHPSEAYLSPELTRELWKSRFITTWLIADLIYNVALMTSYLQGTFGQKAVGIKVIKDDGGKVGYGAAIGRSLMSILSSIFLKIGYIMAAVRKDKKTLHDLVAGTIVIDLNETSTTKADSFKTQKGSKNLKSERITSNVLSSSSTYNNDVAPHNEDVIWEDALNEFESEKRKNGLYAKLYALHKGDAVQIKSEYIQQRFQELNAEAIARHEEFQKQYKESWLSRTTEEQRKKIQHHNIFYENGKFVFKYFKRTKRFSNLDEAISYADWCEKL